MKKFKTEKYEAEQTLQWKFKIGDEDLFYNIMSKWQVEAQITVDKLDKRVTACEMEGVLALCKYFKMDKLQKEKESRWEYFCQPFFKFSLAWEKALGEVRQNNKERSDRKNKRSATKKSRARKQ